MPKGYLIIFTSLAILFGHIGFAGYIFAGDNRLTYDERIDTVLVVAPLTAAYFISALLFVIRNQQRDIVVKTERANGLFYVFSIVIVLSFFVSIFWLLRSYEIGIISTITSLKRGLGAVETILGAAFALIMENLFGSIEKKTNIVEPAPVVPANGG
ncbi:hypothetical protein J2046_003645 [Rhizobium petrolearium]|uniref:hypothetical protein n=1 Tax=Neorhizobium petrolearium TaxID=515361 RepID=UPI001AE67488|nr:hypothetical protein [Neorhizobium petrolearium]MBP1845372.1 hypothetical protein [Neorhizobium petrolearium]